MPLLAVGLNGELYEENSLRDDGKGIGRLPTFADEGSTVFGALDQRQIKNRAIHKARNKKIARMKFFQKQKRKKIFAAQDRKRRLIQEQAARFEKARQLAKDKRIAALHHKARRQSSMGYEYNDLIGNIHEGFGRNGQVVGSDFTYQGNDFNTVDSFGGNSILGSHHMGEYSNGLGGWSIKKPFKVKVKAPRIKLPSTLKAVVKDVGKIAAKTITAPTQIGFKILKSVPLVKDVYKSVDKLTGGTLTSVERVSNLPNKIAAGKPISKADLMEAVMMAVKVGAIVASGGSAASLVSAGAGMLKGGPLGKSALGQNLLSIAEVGGAAAALYQASASKAAEQAAKTGSKELAKQAAKEGSKEVAKQTLKESVQKAVQGKAMEMAKQKALAEVQKKTGIPVGLIVALQDIKGAEGSIAEKTKMFATKIGEEKLKKAGLGDAATQAILSGNAQALGVMVKDAPNLAMSQAKRQLIAQKVKIQEQASLSYIQKKLEDKLAKAKREATDIGALKDRLDKEANEAIKKQLSLQLAKMVEGNAKTQEEVIFASSEYQVEGMKSAVKVAAAEEGRYEGSSLSHPLLALNNKIKGAA